MTQDFLNSQKEKAIIALSKFKWTDKQRAILELIAKNGKVVGDILDNCIAFGLHPQTSRRKGTCILVGNPNKKKTLFLNVFVN